MSDTGTVVRAKVKTTSPLTVLMPGAAKEQPATSHWSGSLAAEQQVIVIVMTGGATYVQGPA